MESFEVGQKMRSAVKAKLLELGTGGSAGYIDDELPDYVMIMVANKRSKQQMIADLNLFLGTQTELFVTWLHEVLQKLQAVTVPAASVVPKKRKSSSHKDEIVSTAGSSTKKDKKSAKKEKRSTNKKTEEGGGSKITNESLSIPIIPSISEVFAGEFLEKAKKSFDIDVNISLKTQKHRKKSPSATESTRTHNSDAVIEPTNDFDIPTISQISTDTLEEGNIILTESSENKREKDLAELAEIQKKIYAAKKQLKTLEESEDEDFLNIKEDGSGEEFDDAGDLVKKQQLLQQEQQQQEDQVEKPSGTRPKSPIVFDRNCREQNVSSPPILRSRKSNHPPELPTSKEDQRGVERNIDDTTSRSRFTDYEQRERDRDRKDRERERESAPKKKSIHERLGVKSIKNGSSTVPTQQITRRAEKELYVPAFRRKEAEQEQRGRNRETRSSPHDTNPRQKLVTKTINASSERKRRAEHKDRSPTPVSPPPTRQRVVSRVIVAPPSKPEQESSDDANDKPVSSVITIKPRPAVSPSKQACKNLLLRAVAEAQRSTILAKPKKEPTTVARSRSPLAKNTKYFTKTYRDRLKRESAGSSTLFRRSTQNLVIEVDASCSTAPGKRRRRGDSIEIINQSVTHIDEEEEEEYIPDVSHLSELNFVYVPQLSHGMDVEEADDFLESEDNHHEMSADLVVADEEDIDDHNSENKTQFVVTMNEDKPDSKYMQKVTLKSRQNGHENEEENLSATNHPVACKYRYSRERNKSDLKNRYKIIKPTAMLSPASSAFSVAERDSANSSPSCHTPPPRPASVTKKTELIDVYRKPKEFRKIIIQNDSDDDEANNIKSTKDGAKLHEAKSLAKSSPSSKNRETKKHSNRSMTPPLPFNHEISLQKYVEANSQTNSLPEKRKRTPIKFDLDKEDSHANDRYNNGGAGGDGRDDTPIASKRQRSESKERDSGRQSSADRNYDKHKSTSDVKSPKRHGNDDAKQKISIRNTEAKKYENIPALSSVAIDSSALKGPKLKERCKYHPTCTKDNCEFYHPTAPCKSFPNCKFANKCLYTHPKCKFDLTCTKINCNFSHSIISPVQSGAPPLSSHVVPVQNYKSISATTPLLPMCKYYPNCSKPSCTFYHPKMCRFGKNCNNKHECNYYHHELQSSNKFKWVASIG